MTDIVERLRKRQMMQDVRGTGDRFVKQIAVPDALCQLAADEIERLRAERDELRELLCECRIALMWPGGPAQAFLDRIDAATAEEDAT